MAVRAGALTSPVAGLAQYGRAPHEHSRGRHSPASVQGALTFPAAGRRLLPSAALRCSRSDSRRAPEAEACWRAAAPATPWGGCSRLATTCGAGIAQPGEEQGECSTSGRPLEGLRVPSSGMARLGSSGGATLQRSKLDLKQETKTMEPKLDDGMGGGNNGKNIHNGGGGDNDGGDDDDYFDNFDGGDGEGDDGAFFRTVIEQLYDRRSINAVLQEWFRTLESLPAILRGSVEMGLFSSAQLVRFLSMDVRPSVARAVTRSLPPQVARDIVGRLMADPAFVQKMLIEVGLTTGTSLVWEYQQRRERFMRELDFVAINTLSLATSTAALVWLMSPNRASGVLKAGWQRTLHDLPNHIFDASSPARRITPGQRVGGLATKVVELSAVGTVAGAAMSGLGQAALAIRRMGDPAFSPAVPVPELRASMGGAALAMGAFSNARYQIVGGVDRWLFDHSTYLIPYLAVSTVFRTVSAWSGQQTRLHLQGLPVKPPGHVYKQRVAPGVTIREQKQPAAAAAAKAPSRAGTGAPRKAKKRAPAASRGFEMSATMA